MRPIVSFALVFLVCMGAIHAKDKPAEATVADPQMPKRHLTHRKKLGSERAVRKHQAVPSVRKSSQGGGESAVAKAWREADI